MTEHYTKSTESVSKWCNPTAYSWLVDHIAELERAAGERTR